MVCRWRSVFCTLIAATAECAHAHGTTPDLAASRAKAERPACITRAAMRAALEEVMPPRARVQPPPGLVLAPQPTDSDCATLEHLKTSLRLAQRRRW